MIDEARGHLAECFIAGDYGGQWQPLVQKIRKDIPSLHSPREVVRYAQSEIPFESRERQPEALYVLYEMLLKRTFPWFRNFIGKIEDNPHSLEHTLVSYDGKVLSNINFWHAHIIFCCVTYCRGGRILEIGGGYGAMAALWHLLFGFERYVIVDIPECLFFAEVCLRDRLGDIVGYYNGNDPGTKILLVPIEKLDSYRLPSDIVVNVGSMQEMTDDWVEYYMRWIDGYDAKYFYSMNYAGQPIYHQAEGQCHWGPRVSPKWTLRLLNADPPMMTVQNSFRYFAETIYEKMTADTVEARFADRASYLMVLDEIRRNLDKPEYVMEFLTRTIEVFPMQEMAWIASEMLAKGYSEAQPIVDRLKAIRQMGTSKDETAFWLNHRPAA